MELHQFLKNLTQQWHLLANLAFTTSLWHCCVKLWCRPVLHNSKQIQLLYRTLSNFCQIYGQLLKFVIRTRLIDRGAFFFVLWSSSSLGGSIDAPLSWFANEEGGGKTRKCLCFRSAGQPRYRACFLYTFITLIFSFTEDTSTRWGVPESCTFSSVFSMSMPRLQVRFQPWRLA